MKTRSKKSSLGRVAEMSTLFLSVCKTTEAFAPKLTTTSTYVSSSSLHADLITFDLDDTIFPVGPVVHDANVALMNHLQSLGVATSQPDFLASTKKIRSGLAKEGKTITYTELRKRAIKYEMEKYLSQEEITMEEVNYSYELWEEHRQMAADRHLYHDTISMLDQLKECFPDATIAAITNGKGNPLRMNSIKDYFDYCISGEDDGVFPNRKPSAGIYQVALERFKEVSGRATADNEDEFCWVHVGDDLANDVGASAQCGAKSVWVDLGEEYNQTASKRSKSGSSEKEQQPAWSTATKEELEKRRKMNEEAQQYVAARITTLDELPGVVKEITMSNSASLSS